MAAVADTVYSFELGIKAYPDKDSLQTRDTLWLEVNSPTAFQDRFSGQTIDYSNAENLGSAIGFSKLLSNGSFADAANMFDYRLLLGQQITNGSSELIREYNFIEKDKHYTFRLGIIPKDTGIFSIVMSNAANVYRSTDNCTKAAFEINFDSTNQHYYLNPNSNGYNGKGGDYYFKVY